MPTFTELGIDQDPNLPFLQNDTSQVEPLDGPVSVDSLMDRFPDTVYTQGRDTHLYKFITAMCGDAGAGLLKKQAYILRLMDEGELLTFTDLDTFYVQTLRFPRLSNEIYTGDSDVDVFTQEEWDTIAQKDEHYRQRIQDFFNGARLGNSPGGMALIAKSGSGVPVEVIENYKALFDLVSDDALGLAVEGNTNSPNEFILIPRILDADGNADPDISYSSTFSKQYNLASNTGVFILSPDKFLDPKIERNMVDVLDRLRPVGALMSIKNKEVVFKVVNIDSIDASSERIYVTRFVTGVDAVVWPNSDTDGHFIESGVENEAPFFALSVREMPTIFQTIDNANAYTEAALDDPAYNTSDFYLLSNAVSPYLHYQSEHTGSFFDTISKIYPFLKTVSSQGNFVAQDAISSQDTQLILEGRNT